MKSKFLLVALLGLVGAIASADAHRTSNAFEVIDEKLCRNAEFDNKEDTVTCKAANAETVMTARVGKKLTKKELNDLKFDVYDAVTAGFVVDADSNTAYFFVRWLVDEEGEKVGVITYEGWYNDEMGVSARFDLRYNLKGQLVFASTAEMR